VTLGPLRIELCGRFVVRDGGRRLDAELPGRQGRVLLAYLVLERHRPVSRDELVEAVWPEGAPAASDAALSALLSKLRRALGPDRLGSGTPVALRLPADVWIDVEAAAEALHRAESAVAREPGVDLGAPSAQLEPALMEAWGGRARLHLMPELQQIAGVVIACGAAVVFALMAWAGQHQS